MSLMFIHLFISSACIGVHQCVRPTLPPHPPGAHHFSPECVELKPPACRRRIAVVKYSSSTPGGTLSLPTDRPLLL